MPKISLPKYLKWLERRNLSQKTIYVYSWALRKYGLKEFDTDSIAIFFKEELNRYQPNGLNSLLNGLVSYAKFAKIEIEWELITRLIPTVQQKFFPTVNENELNRLKLVRTKTKPTINQRNNVIFDFLFNTGIRIGELVNIRHCDYQDGNLLIHGKGNKDRYIPIPPFLEKYFNGSSDFMFKTWKGKMDQKAVRSMIFRKVEKAGFNKNITPHTFRRSFATLSNNRGVKLTAIQKVLGHSDINTTTNYIHNSREELYQEYSKLWLNSPPPPPPPQHLFLKSRK